MRAALPDRVALEVDGGVHARDAPARSSGRAPTCWSPALRSSAPRTRPPPTRRSLRAAPAGAAGRASRRGDPRFAVRSRAMLLGRRTSTVFGVLATSVALTACGGSSSPSGTTPAAYVKVDLPSRRAVREGRADPQQLAEPRHDQEPRSRQDGAPGLPQRRRRRHRYRRQQAEGRRRADVSNGKQISTAIVGAFTQLKTAISRPPARPAPCRPPARRVQDRGQRAGNQRPHLDERHRLEPQRAQEPGARERGQEGTHLSAPRRLGA